MDQVYPPAEFIFRSCCYVYFHFPENITKGEGISFSSPLSHGIFFSPDFSAAEILFLLLLITEKKIPYLGLSDETKDSTADSGVRRVMRQ